MGAAGEYLRRLAAAGESAATVGTAPSTAQGLLRMAGVAMVAAPAPAPAPPPAPAPAPPPPTEDELERRRRREADERETATYKRLSSELKDLRARADHFDAGYRAGYEAGRGKK